MFNLRKIAMSAPRALIGPTLESPAAPQGGSWKSPIMVPLAALQRFCPRAVRHIRLRRSGEERIEYLIRALSRDPLRWPASIPPLEVALAPDGSARLMDGNHRLIAARQLVLPGVPVAFLLVPARDDRFVD